MGFGTVEFDLSFDRDRVGGDGNLTANYYTVEKIKDGDVLRPLSIGQLVMALCLSRAVELEAKIIDIVENLNKTSEDLEKLTKIEKDIVETEVGSLDLTAEKFSDGQTYESFLKQKDISVMSILANSSSEQLLTDIEAKMDSLNSLSQQTMIDLQSLTAKRDQSYDMISNIVKSLYTTLATVANNI